MKFWVLIELEVEVGDEESLDPLVHSITSKIEEDYEEVRTSYFNDAGVLDEPEED